MRNSIRTVAHPYASVIVEPKASVEAILDDYCLARDSRLLREPILIEDSDESYAELHLGLAAG